MNTIPQGAMPRSSKDVGKRKYHGEFDEKSALYVAGLNKERIELPLDFDCDCDCDCGGDGNSLGRIKLTKTLTFLEIIPPMMETGN